MQQGGQHRGKPEHYQSKDNTAADIPMHKDLEL